MTSSKTQTTSEDMISLVHGPQYTIEITVKDAATEEIVRFGETSSFDVAHELLERLNRSLSTHHE